MDFGLKIEQQQKLVMTMELQQAIALLQLSTTELQNHIQEEILNNPVLEVQEKENEFETDKTDPDEQSPDTVENGSVDWEEYFSDFEPYGSGDKKEWNKGSSYVSPLDYLASREVNLQEHLQLQLTLSSASGPKRLIGEYLIGNLDANGYLQGEISEHAGFLGVDETEILEALKLIQTFEPTGVGARSLRECLRLQLDVLEDTNPFAAEIVENYLPELAQGNHREVARKLGITRKKLQEALDFIRTLDPKPGACLGGAGETKYIVPDVVVENVEGEYVIVINDDFPSLYINPFYRNLLRSGCEEGVDSFIKERLDSALWLLRSIEQRRLTIYRVTEQIIKIQKPFLEKGIHHLQPLTLKDVAEKIDMHESTVSRATTNKYVQTPRGLYSLKFFFSGSIGGAKGEVYSSSSVKARVKQLIDEEKPDAPYSDQKIKELLEKEGIQLSRRTVAKYRLEMKIPSSSQRRRIS